MFEARKRIIANRGLALLPSAAFGLSGNKKAKPVQNLYSVADCVPSGRKVGRRDGVLVDTVDAGGTERNTKQEYSMATGGEGFQY